MNNKEYEELQKEIIRLRKENEILKDNQIELNDLRSENYYSNLIIDFIDMNFRQLNNQEDITLLTPKERANNIQYAQEFLQSVLHTHKETKLPIDDDFIKGLESMMNEIIKLSVDLYKDFPDKITVVKLTKGEQEG